MPGQCTSSTTNLQDHIGRCQIEAANNPTNDIQIVKKILSQTFLRDDVFVVHLSSFGLIDRVMIRSF